MTTFAVTRRERAIINHPDRRSAWTVVLAATLAEPLTEGLLRERLGALAVAAPITAARLAGEAWRVGPPAVPRLVAADPLDDPALVARFALGSEPPLRVALGADGTRLVVAGHHAALDGRGLAAVLGALLGLAIPPSGDASESSPGAAGATGGGLPWGLVETALRPADRVAPDGTGEHFAARDTPLAGPHTTPRMTAACVAATQALATQRGRPLRRIDVTLGVGGTEGGVGNHATLRRISVGSGDDAAALAQTALAAPPPPGELGPASRVSLLMRPLVNRFSDTLLVSNLGPVRAPCAVRLEFYPVARGRSAVAFGGIGLVGGPSVLSVRTLHAAPETARQLLDAAASALA